MRLRRRSLDDSYPFWLASPAHHWILLSACTRECLLYVANRTNECTIAHKEKLFSLVSQFHKSVIEHIVFRLCIRNHQVACQVYDISTNGLRVHEQFPRNRSRMTGYNTNNRYTFTAWPGCSMKQPVYPKTCTFRVRKSHFYFDLANSFAFCENEIYRHFSLRIFFIFRLHTREYGNFAYDHCFLPLRTLYFAELPNGIRFETLWSSDLFSSPRSKRLSSDTRFSRVLHVRYTLLTQSRVTISVD